MSPTLRTKILLLLPSRTISGTALTDSVPTKVLCPTTQNRDGWRMLTLVVGSSQSKSIGGDFGSMVLGVALDPAKTSEKNTECCSTLGQMLTWIWSTLLCQIKRRGLSQRPESAHDASFECFIPFLLRLNFHDWLGGGGAHFTRTHCLSSSLGQQTLLWCKYVDHMPVSGVLPSLSWEVCIWLGWWVLLATSV